MKNFSVKTSEKTLQSKIIRHLERNGWIVIKTILLNKNGYPDIFAFRDGRTIFIEVKGTDGVVSKLQELRIKQLQSEGFTAFVCRNFEELINKLMKYENKQAGALMLKLLVGIDIADSALTDMDIKDSKDKEFIKSVKAAKKASAKVVAAYDNMIGTNAKTDLLSEIYEKCNQSVEWQLKKICNL